MVRGKKVKLSNPGTINQTVNTNQEQALKLIPFKGDALTLTEEEAKRLAELESKIDRSNADRGRALREIRDSRLYRATHPNLETYLKVRWGMSRSRAYQLIDFADELDLSTNVDKPKTEGEHRAKKAKPVAVPTSIRPALEASIAAEIKKEAPADDQRPQNGSNPADPAVDQDGFESWRLF